MALGENDANWMGWDVGHVHHAITIYFFVRMEAAHFTCSPFLMVVLAIKSIARDLNAIRDFTGRLSTVCVCVLCAYAS